MTVIRNTPSPYLCSILLFRMIPLSVVSKFLDFTISIAGLRLSNQRMNSMMSIISMN